MKQEPLGRQLPRVLTKPPGPKSCELVERARRCESPALSGIKAGEVPIFWELSRGANVVDVDGNIYVDMGSGFAAAVTGHSNPRVVQAIQQQSEQLMHSMGVIHSHTRRVELAEKLAEIAPGDLEAMRDRHPLISDMRGLGLLVALEFAVETLDESLTEVESLL